MGPTYRVVAEADVALASGVAKSVLGIKSGSLFGMQVTEATISFDGQSASAEPVLVQFCHATFATNSPGTNSTSVTVQRSGGRQINSGTTSMTAARAWSSEPTVLSVLREFLVHPQAGIVIQIPLGGEADCDVNEGFVIRATAPASVNARAEIEVRRI